MRRKVVLSKYVFLGQLQSKTAQIIVCLFEIGNTLNFVSSLTEITPESTCVFLCGT